MFPLLCGSIRNLMLKLYFLDYNLSISTLRIRLLFKIAYANLCNMTKI